MVAVHAEPKSFCRRGLLALLGVASTIFAPHGAAAQIRSESLDGLWTVRALSGERGERPLEAGDPARTAQHAWVPAAWEHILGEDFDGVAEFTRVVRARRPERGVRYRLHFAAVMTHARVFFNDRELGEHLGGWTPFDFEVPKDAFVDGDTQKLRVVVDERVGHATQGFLPDIAPHFGGIWQSVTWKRLEASCLDPARLEVRTRVKDGRGVVDVKVRYRVSGRARLVAHLRRGDLVVGSAQADPGGNALSFSFDRPRIWTPENPQQYRLDIALRDIGASQRAHDKATRTLAFCDVRVRGREIYVAGRPRALRGILHWGYAPPHYAPHPPEAYWREEMRFAKAAGFDMIKACLWLPPPRFFQVALEEGLFVWSDYPAWHPDFSPAKREALLQEYGEFFRADRVWPHVVARSLTCETGRGSADAGVVKALFEKCKRETGGVLVEDDSSWITWNRFHDFYDDHPYGNPHDWVARLEGFEAHIQKSGPKPLLIGEAFAGDSWVDIAALDAWRRRGGGGDKGLASMWWRPLALPSMRAFERRVELRWGSDARRALVPDSKLQAMRLRKYQIEAFRRMLPRAGYTVSVMRDFRRARMGFFDDSGEPKWKADEFRWHGARMLVLDDPRAIRSISHERIPGFVPRVLLAGNPPGKVSPRSSPRLAALKVSMRVETAAGRVIHRVETSGRRRALHAERSLLWRVSGPVRFGGLMPNLPDEPLRVRATMTLRGAAKNSWEFWAFPGQGPVKDAQEQRAPKRLPAGVRVARGLDAETFDWVVAGGRLLLLPGPGAPTSRGLWFLEGAAYGAQEHALLEGLPRAMLHDLQAFDLHGPVFHATELTKGFDVAFAYWDTHDERERVQEFPMLGEAKVGEGRIVLCALGISEEAEAGFDRASARREHAGPGPRIAPNPARAWLRSRLLWHLTHGPEARVALSSELIARVRASLRSERVALDGIWRLQKDPDRVGVEQKWFAFGAAQTTSWIESRAGAHWESAGLPHYTGQAWYQKSFDAPASWKPGQPLWLVCDGVDDSYEVYVNGQSVGRHGDEASGETVWLVRTSTEISRAVHKGRNSLVLRVVDHAGAGGLHRPVRLSTAKPERVPLLQKR